MNLLDLYTEDIRLIILRALEQVPGYSLNESILHSVVGRFGHKCGRDCIRTQIAWLCEQGLLTYDDVEGCYVATATGRGIDVAIGAAVVPGVKRPRP